MRKLFILLLIFFSVNAYATEEILSFHSEIEVFTDRSIVVTEHITVMAEGVNIQRGIFRDIPTAMINERGRKVKYSLEVLEVLKEGQPENYSEMGISDGTRIRIGNADVMLKPGKYAYTIKYKMANQVRFFDEYDELYWNATGNQWGFMIQDATATVTLPADAKILHHTGYSGYFGDEGCACVAAQDQPNKITYKMTEALYPSQGLTVAIGWNKGVIPPPTEAELRKEEIRGYLPLLVGIGGVLLVFIYYLLAWFKVGIDPKKGAIIPRFEAPEGFSPAASRFVMQMRFDNKAFSASLVNMAVKGYLTIDKTGKNYILKKLTDDQSKLTKGEKKIADALFRSSDTFEVKQTNHARLRSAINALKSRVDTDFTNMNFRKNSGWLVPGILISIFSIIAMLVMSFENEEVFLGLIISFFASMFVFPFVLIFVQIALRSHGIAKYIFSTIAAGIVIGILVLLYQFVLEFDPEYNYVRQIGPYYLVIFSVIIMNIVFFYLIKAPTVYGRERMDELEGLKMYMEVAEKDRLNVLNPPEQTPQLFEKLLPYAIALNVENAWGKKFESVIDRAIQNNEYRPTWYAGKSGDVFRAHLLASSLGASFSSSVSSASVSPQSSSSSGSRGGGFSGGGGGGGGGGGW